MPVALDDHACCRSKLIATEELRAWLTIRRGCWALTGWLWLGSRTGRLRAAAGAAVADRGRTVVQAARDHGVSWPVVAAAFTDHAQAVLPDQPHPVQVLGIDEVRRGRPKWVFDEATGAWQTVVDR